MHPTCCVVSSGYRCKTLLTPFADHRRKLIFRLTLWVLVRISDWSTRGKLNGSKWENMHRSIWNENDWSGRQRVKIDSVQTQNLIWIKSKVWKKASLKTSQRGVATPSTLPLDPPLRVVRFESVGLRKASLAWYNINWQEVYLIITF